MSTEANKALLLRWFEEDKKRNLAAMEELCAPDYVFHGTGVLPDSDLARIKQQHTVFWAAFPDAHLMLEDMIAEGDKVVHRYTFRGTHQGDFMGVPATGKVVTVTGICISRFAGGKFVEEWDNQDVLGLMQQLGAIPQMAQGGA